MRCIRCVPVSPVHQQDIQIAVGIVIQKRAASTHRFRHVTFAGSTSHVPKSDACRFSDIDEFDIRACREMDTMDTMDTKQKNNNLANLHKAARKVKLCRIQRRCLPYRRLSRRACLVPRPP